MQSPVYIYSAQVLRVVDGDTVDLDIDCGLCIAANRQRMRLAGIDTPEIRGVERPEGLVSAAWLRERIEGRDVIVQTEKDRRGDDEKGKFGRWLARIWIDGVCVNDELLANGLAKVPSYLR